MDGECVAKLRKRNAAGSDQIVNEFMRCAGEGMRTMMSLLYTWIYMEKRART